MFIHKGPITRLLLFQLCLFLIVGKESNFSLNVVIDKYNVFFFLDKHQESLAKVLLDKKLIPETTISVALAEHIFKMLAPGQDYLLEKKIKKCCPCGKCKYHAKTGNTDIGMFFFFKDLTHNSFFAFKPNLLKYTQIPKIT